MAYSCDSGTCDSGTCLPFPIIADENRELSVLLGMLDGDEKDKQGMPLTARCVRNWSSYTTTPDQHVSASFVWLCAATQIVEFVSDQLFVSTQCWLSKVLFWPWVLPSHFRSLWSAQTKGWSCPSSILPLQEGTLMSCFELLTPCNSLQRKRSPLRLTGR